jgi:soluble lytic murein transglycosylase-like protein
MWIVRGRIAPIIGLFFYSSAAVARPASFVQAHAQGSVMMPDFIGTAALQPGAATKFAGLISSEASSAQLPVEIARAVVQIESGYDPDAIGSVGEVGLMQVRPSTAEMMGFRGTPTELAKPEVNIKFGVRYLAEAWRLSNGDLCRALMKYRAGHGAEVMSTLSVAYCARAREALGGENSTRLSAARSMNKRYSSSLPSTLSQVPARLKRGTPEFDRAFWAAHEAKIANMRARVHSVWRHRGWKPS